LENFITNHDYIQLQCKCSNSIYHTNCLYKWLKLDINKNNKCIGCFTPFDLTQIGIIKDSSNNPESDISYRTIFYHHLNIKKIKIFTIKIELMIIYSIFTAITNLYVSLNINIKKSFHEYILSLSLISYGITVIATFININSIKSLYYSIVNSNNIDDMTNDIIIQLKKINIMIVFTCCIILININICFFLIYNNVKFGIYFYSVQFFVMMLYKIILIFYDGPVTRLCVNKYRNKFFLQC
jgi:hypothetical protein